MSDLVNSLKAWAPMIASGYEVPAASTVMEQAAAEILRLRDALAVVPDHYREGWIAGRDAAVEHLETCGIEYGDAVDYADDIRNMEPPA